MKNKYWDEVYQNKKEDEVSWFQEIPKTSLELIEEFEVHRSDKIIDIGGGDSRLVDSLLDLRFKDITILDISEVALERCKARLGNRSTSVKFVASDITKFTPSEKHKLWHDRAAFHFLTDLGDIQAYLKVASQAIEPDGFLILSTFSKTGPEKCSGLPVSQYSDSDLKSLFQKPFSNIRCFEEIHHTPKGLLQSFVYCGFKRRAE